MPTANWATLAPTAGTPGNSYETGVDVYVGAAWLNIPDISSVNPKFTPKVRARTSYAVKGQTYNNKYAQDVVLTFDVETVRDASNQVQAELAALMALAAANGAANRTQFRFFDVLGAEGFCYSGVGSVEVDRKNVGDNDSDWYTVTVTGYGQWAAIANPVNVAAVPQIVKAGPTAAAVSTVVTVQGVGFTGVTAGHVGAGVVTGLLVLDDRTVQFTMPAGSAGVTFITLTNANGTSAQLPYTRGA